MVNGEEEFSVNHGWPETGFRSGIVNKEEEFSVNWKLEFALL